MHSLLAQFTDLAGVAKGKLVPLAHLDELLANGVGFAGPSIVGTGLPRVGPRSEYYARGNASTATVLPWMPGVARIVCDGFVDDQPFEACPRQVLKRAVAHLAERGWQLRTGIEPEFFLLRRDGERWLPADAADRLDKPSYDLKSLARQGEYLHALHGVLAQCGLDVLQLDHEDAHGQFEVNFGFDDALTSADHVMLFKLAAHALAEARGLQFSMMPKPFAHQAGSGMHMHVSLWGGGSARHPDHARNLFTPHRADGSADLEATLSRCRAPPGRRCGWRTGRTTARWPCARCTAASSGVCRTRRRTPTSRPRPSSPPGSTASTAGSNCRRNASTTCTNWPRPKCRRAAMRACRRAWARRSTRCRPTT